MQSLNSQKKNSPSLFDAIARRYDLTNGFISLGQDRRWRRYFLQGLPTGRDLVVLDIATGTGDVAIMLGQDVRVRTVIGIDLSDGMLHLGRRKVTRSGLDGNVVLQKDDAMNLSFADQSFDVVTISFGIRNMPETARCLAECFRVLKPGGSLMILESGQPNRKVIRRFNRFYVERMIPWLGGALSGRRSAYEYLNQTIATFPSGSDFLALMSAQGFQQLACQPLLLGSVYFYRGYK